MQNQRIQNDPIYWSFIYKSNPDGHLPKSNNFQSPYGENLIIIKLPRTPKITQEPNTAIHRNANTRRRPQTSLHMYYYVHKVRGKLFSADMH